MEFSKRLMGLALALTAFAGAAPAMAQGTVRGEYGDW